MNSTWRASWRSQNAFCRAHQTSGCRPLDYKQRLQQLFFPEGVAFDGNRFNRTAATAPLFKYSAPDQRDEESLACRAEALGKGTAAFALRRDSLRLIESEGW